ncbi:proline-rich receptor-like protein kinase PERK2 [Mus caroli]|uniref:Proline-rich receptor-like protein kinase PERK2 n=1 Tax=Mus caroli TaxID=10089 RepID=A0A6P5P529_MUSCR|nr:proline-rich receptor-like protein kinase PERK2 [Mus caroli]
MGLYPPSFRVTLSVRQYKLPNTTQMLRPQPLELGCLLHIFPAPSSTLPSGPLSSPQASPRTLPRPRTPSPSTAGSSASSPEAGPRHAGQTPLPSPLTPASAEPRHPPHIDRSLPERGLRRTTSDPLSLHCSPPPESWSAESPLGSLGEQESGPVALRASSSLSSEWRGRRIPGTHLVPVVNISPGFPSTNSSARAPLPSPRRSRSRGPAFPPLPSSLRPSARPPATHQRGPAARGAGRSAEGKDEGCPHDCLVQMDLRLWSLAMCSVPPLG